LAIDFVEVVKCNEKLASVCVRTTIRHCDYSWFPATESTLLVFETVTIVRDRSRPIAFISVTSLHNETWNDSVEWGVAISDGYTSWPKLVGAELTKVLARARALIGSKFNGHSANRPPGNAQIKENTRPRPVRLARKGHDRVHHYILGVAIVVKLL
jgi:hypothetical protein